MNIKTYREIQVSVRNDWDAEVLDVLGKGPHRFAELVRHLRSDIQAHIEQGTVSRALTRLRSAGYVQATPAQDGRRKHFIYALTEEGRRRLVTFRALIAAYEETRSLPARCITACPHGGTPLLGEGYGPPTPDVIAEPDHGPAPPRPRRRTDRQCGREG
jgi:DNA-binding PadR family transcriptional regulator